MAKDVASWLVGLKRYTAATISTGLTGGGVVQAVSGYLPTASNGATIPVVFTID